MTLEYALGGAITAAVLIYLVYALLRPERFQAAHVRSAWRPSGGWARKRGGENAADLAVVFANFAEAMAEARGRAQADTVHATKKETPARRLVNGHEEMVSSSSAIGIAGMDRVTRFNVRAMSGRAVEAAGDVDTLLLDKTGTITFGNRLAAEIIPVNGASMAEALLTARRSSSGRTTRAVSKLKAGTAHSVVRSASRRDRDSGTEIGGRRRPRPALDRATLNASS
jgi:K+-transporting ATPase KdpF subunit